MTRGPSGIPINIKVNFSRPCLIPTLDPNLGDFLRLLTIPGKTSTVEYVLFI